MTSLDIATWILAGATLLIALEGGTALFRWLLNHRTSRKTMEIRHLRQQVELVRLALWMNVARAGQGTTVQIEQRVQNLLMSDGWRPDMEEAERAGYFKWPQ